MFKPVFKSLYITIVFQIERFLAWLEYDQIEFIEKDKIRDHSPIK